MGVTKNVLHKLPVDKFRTISWFAVDYVYSAMVLHPAWASIFKLAARERQILPRLQGPAHDSRRCTARDSRAAESVGQGIRFLFGADRAPKPHGIQTGRKPRAGRESLWGVLSADESVRGTRKKEGRHWCG